MNALIDAQELEHLLQNEQLILLDFSSKETYDNGHIPGAISLSSNDLCSGIKPAPGKLPDKEKLQSLLQRIGLKNESLVVCYDDAGFSWSGRMIWILDLINHQNTAIINGGLNAWLDAGFNIETKNNEATPSNFTISHIENGLIADKEEILQKLSNKTMLIWDVRSKEEFTGEKKLAERGGHIPGAIHLEWTELHNDKGEIKPTEQIQALLTRAGLSGEKEIITHCQTHRRSGLSYFVGKKLLGYNMIKAYPGSWSEWGNDSNLPIER